MPFVPDSDSGSIGRFVPDQSAQKKKELTWAEVAADTGIDLAKGVVGLGESAVGVADLFSGNLVGEGLGSVGYDPKRTKEFLSEYYSDPRQEANRAVSEAKGFVDTTAAMVKNPSAAVGSIVESSPMMIGSAAAVRSAAVKMLAARGIAAGTPEAAAILSNPATIAKLTAIGSAAEGAMTAGSIQEGGRQAGRDYLETAPYAVAGGAITGLIGQATSKIPGFRDAEVGAAIAGMGGSQRQSLIQAGKEIAKGTFKEGVLEELPQSAQEQVFSNLAQGKPWNEGVPEAAAQGMVAGGGMGGGMSTYSAARNAVAVPEQAPAAPATTQTAQEAMQQAAAPVVAAPEPTEAEKALMEPKSLTALDRVNEINTEDQRISARLSELNAPDSGYGEMFDQERQDLATKRLELTQEREGITTTWPKAQPGATTNFSTEAGARVDAQYALIEASDLTTSHDESLRANPTYPQELQPRERDRAASEMQVSGIVQKLDPARLGLSADAANGAPIVGADGLVESGNARTIALKRVYQANGQKAADYKQFLKDNAAQFGLTPEQVDGMQKPVLVRVRTTPVNRAEFARQANASTVAQMSPSEQAKSDAARIDTMEDLTPDDSGDFSGASSRPFVRRFMAKLPTTEQAGMVDANGDLSTAGYTRVRNAVLAKAYGDSPVLLRMVESMDDNLRNISKALMTAAPKVAQMRQAVAEGVRFDSDITPDLMAAVEELSRLKDEGSSIHDALAQGGMFGDKYTQETRDLLQFLADNIRKPRRMADFVLAYMDALDVAGDPNQGSLLGDVAAPAKTELMKAAMASTERTTNVEQDTQRGDSGKDAGTGAQDGGRSQDAQGGEGGTQGDGAATATRLSRAPQKPVIGLTEREKAAAEFKEALGELAHLATKNTRLMMMPDETPGLMETLIKLFDAAIKIVGTDLKAATRYVREQLRANADTKKIANFIKNSTMEKAAQQALEQQSSFDLFGQPAMEGVTDAVQERSAKALDAQEPTRNGQAVGGRDAQGKAARAGEEGRQGGGQGQDQGNVTQRTKGPVSNVPISVSGNTITIEGTSYDIDAKNFGMAPWPMPLKKNDPLLIETDKKTEVVLDDGMTRDRKIWRDDVVDGFFVGVTPAQGRKPVAYVMGGGGAAGKGTLLNKTLIPQGLVNDSNAVHLDPDDVKKEIPEYNELIAKGDSRAASVVHEESSGLAKRVLANAMNGKYDLVYDVTLGNKDKGTKTLQALKDAGYEVRLFGVTVEPALAVARADKRARGNGRYVPTKDQLVAHKGFTQAFAEYAELVDQAMLFDTTPPDTALLARKEPGKTLEKISVNGYTKAEKRSEVINVSGITFRAASIVPRGEGQAGERVVREGQGAEPRGEGGDVQRRERDQGPAVADGLVSAGRSVAGTDWVGQGQGQVGKDSGKASSSRSGQEGEVNANGKPGAGRTQEQGAGAAQEPGGQGQAQRVRAGTGEPDLFGGVAESAGDRAGAGVQQTDANRPDEGGRGDEYGAGAGTRGGARADAGVPAGRDIPAKTGRNYAFGPGDLTYEGNWRKKAEQNVQALELLKKLETEGRQATHDEQTILAKFIGWGSSEIANNLFGGKLDKAIEAQSAYESAMSYFERNGGRDIATRDPGFYQAFQVINAASKTQLNYYQVGPISKAAVEKAKPDTSTLRWMQLRERMKAVMTEQEWAEASRSTQYAHYTSKEVVRSMWRALERMGFSGGRILEPGAGIGVFPGLMPSAMAANSIYTGIEFDTMTGRILSHLFPDERILVESFVDTKLPKNFYDVAVGNPPFSGTKILSDPEYAKRAFSLHDYFFAKSIDRTKPGGLVVYITSRYTMDKLDDKARQYLSDRADLVGAIRLPQTAFKQNAGTEVVTDVIFLRKKAPGEKFDGAQGWGKSVPIDVNGNKYNINEYFAAHPEMVLGQHADTGSMYKDREYTVTPMKGDIEALFGKAVENLPANIYHADRGSSAEAAQVREIDFNPKAKKEGNFYVSDAGVLMVREGGVGQPVELRVKKDVELLKDFVPLRDALKQAHYDQLNDGEWQTSLKTLQKAYADFTKKHGPVNQFTTKVVKTKEVDEDTGEAYTDETQVRVFTLDAKLNDDPDWTLVQALETVNDDTGEIKPSAFLTDRVLGKPEAAQVNTPIDAMLSSLNDVGRVDIPLIAKRVGLSESDTIEALGSSIYEDPETGWQTADEYLSGNVKRKLDAAREAVKAEKRFERNVVAMEAAQPAPKTPSQINIGIGMNWVPGEVYAKFLSDIAGVRANVQWNERTKQWIVDELGGGKSMQATADWGTGERNATDLLEHALTGRPIRVTQSVGSGSERKTVFNASATEAANQKLDALRERFASWVWEDDARTESLVRIYNDTFNTTVPRSFDGRHLMLPGTSKQFSVFDHVKRGAWRIIQRGNTYLAHAVGSGKTFQMVIAAMEQKRLGLIKKPMVVVPNHMLKQFASEWQQLYPAARLMVADENNFHTNNRRRFVSRVALSDLDGVVITHSAFKLLDLDPEFKQKMIEEQLSYMRAALEEAGGDAGSKGKSRDPRIKQIEKQIENLEQKLEAAMSPVGKDTNVRFDELGVDFLMVDEAHEFRKLDFATSRQVKGISPQGSARAFDLYMKSRYLEEKTPGRSLVMASGTPVTNTLAELFTVQKFMDRQALIDRGIEDFDSWAAMFGRERTVLEPNAAGKYEPVTRFSKFVNVPELTQMFREYADVLTSDHLAALLGDKRPKVKGGSRNILVTPKTDAYSGFQGTLADRVEISRSWKPSKDQPNNPDPMIRIIGDGRLAAIDMRFMDPTLPSDPDSKLNRMIDDVIKVSKEGQDMQYQDKAGNTEPNKGAAMMVFSDLGFGAGVAENRGFNARAWFEKRLRDAGVPMNQVAFMSDHKKSADKLKLFKDVNAGRVRILIGSSKNMGTGVNAQQRLKALFHLDSPWYPSDLEQREGRIIRQGNKNPLVEIYAYAAKGTYDENMWKMLASKQFFIDQALSGDENLRELEDLDSQSQYDLAAAMVAEDPRILQLAGAKAEIEKLQRLYKAHEDQRVRFKTQYNAAKTTVDFNEKRLPVAEADAKKVQDLSGDKFKAKANGKTHTDRADWANGLIAKYKDLTAKGDSTLTNVGEISGFPVVFGGETVAGQYRTKLVLGTPEPIELVTDPGTSPIGVAMRAQNAVSDVARLPTKMRERISEAKAQIDALGVRLEAPFPMSGMLADKVKESNDLEAQIAADSKAKTEEEKAVKAAQTTQDQPTDEAATRLSRGGGGGMEVKSLKSLATRIKAKMPNMPKVNVLTSPDEAPQELQDYILEQGAWGDVEGAMHNGELYLFASGLSDELRAEHVLAEHEAAHFGLRAILGKSMTGVMNFIYANNPTVRKAANELQNLGKLSNADAIEEAIVDMPSSELVKLKGWRRLVLATRDWLVNHGFIRMADQLNAWLDGSITDQERADLFVAELVQGARQYIAGKRQGEAANYAGVTRLSTLAEDIAKQEKWLTAEAKARGYKDIEDLAERNYPLFEKLAALWRQKNPAQNGVMLSRAQGPQATADRAQKIIDTKAGSRAPLEAVAKVLTRITGIERLAGGIYDKVAFLLDRYTPEQVKAGVVSDYGVPEAVIDQRAMLQGRQRVQLRKAGALIEKLSTLTRAESRVAYEWMNMDGADPKAYMSMMEGLPEESVKVLLEIQKMIDSLSKEAVAMGQLSPDAYERNKFAYLRRSYAKHIVEQTSGEKAKRARVISILGDQYKGRGMTETGTMKQIQTVAPEWWGRKMTKGLADTALKGEKFIRLERRTMKEGDIQVRRYKNGKSKVIAGTREVMANPKAAQLAGMEIPDQDTRLREVVYWPAGEPIPTKFSEWDNAGTWEVRDVQGDKAVFWRDFTKDEREQMGEVDEARFAIAKTMHGMIHDVEVGRYLEWMAQTYAKKEGDVIPGVVVEASERYRDTFKQGEWVKVPDTKIAGTNVSKYGKLAGRYLPGPVWNDLRQVVNGQFKPFGETYAKILGMWKTTKTALSPGVHMNNVMSNFVMADWHDVGAVHVAKALRIILGASQRDGRGLIGSVGNLAARAGIADHEAARHILNRYSDSGGDIGSWATQEIAKDQLEPLLADLEKELSATAGASEQAQVGVMSALQHAMMLRFPSAWEAAKGSKPGKVVGTEAQSLINLYQSEDDVFRLAAWLKAKEDGKSDLEAGKSSRKSFLDYHVNAPWIQAMRQSAWPFVAFTYRAVPMFLEIAGKKPHKLLKLMAVAGALNALGVMMAGGDGDDEEKQRKLLPEEKAGKVWGIVPKLIRMPWNDDQGSPVYLDIRRFIPVGDVFDVGQGHSAIPILPGLQPGGPLALLAEVLVNRSMFTGKPITLDTDTAMQKAEKVFDYLYKAFAPNILGLPGTYATTGAIEAAQGKTDSFGRQQSVAQSVASSFGVKLGSYPADVMRLNLNRKAQAELMEIDRNITQLKRQRLINKIDQKEFEEGVAVEQNKQRKVLEEVREKTGG